MKTKTFNIEAGGTMARNVLECGDATCRVVPRRGRVRAVQRLVLLGFFILHSAFIIHAWGQSYSIDWYKVAGGGGASTGATYQVTGTIGQHDAGGAMSGGNYSVTGGFWSLYAVQTLGAPLLTITHSGNTVKVSWPYPSTGWTLQQNSDLTLPANWSASGGISNDGVNNFITLTSPTGNLFFRLKQ